MPRVAGWDSTAGQASVVDRRAKVTLLSEISAASGESRYLPQKVTFRMGDNSFPIRLTFYK